MDKELMWRKYDLLRMRWQLLNGRVACDPLVLPAAICWLDGEIAAIEKQPLAG